MNTDASRQSWRAPSKPAALETLAAAGRSERHEEGIKLCHDLEHHARAEEEILYPAAVLAGEYVRLAESD